MNTTHAIFDDDEVHKVNPFFTTYLLECCNPSARSSLVSGSKKLHHNLIADSGTDASPRFAKASRVCTLAGFFRNIDLFDLACMVSETVNCLQAWNWVSWASSIFLQNKLTSCGSGHAGRIFMALFRTWSHCEYTCMALRMHRLFFLRTPFPLLL